MADAYLLELLDGTLVDTTALVDQVTSGGGLAGIDVAIGNGQHESRRGSVSKGMHVPLEDKLASSSMNEPAVMMIRTITTTLR